MKIPDLSRSNPAGIDSLWAFLPGLLELSSSSASSSTCSIAEFTFLSLGFPFLLHGISVLAPWHERVYIVLTLFEPLKANISTFSVFFFASFAPSAKRNPPEGKEQPTSGWAGKHPHNGMPEPKSWRVLTTGIQDGRPCPAISRAIEEAPGRRGRQECVRYSRASIAALVPRRVFCMDSLGNLLTKPLIIHPKPGGRSRDSEMARHSA